MDETQPHPDKTDQNSENKSQDKNQDAKKKPKTRKWKKKQKYPTSVSPPRAARVIFVPKVKEDSNQKKARSILVHSDTEKDKNRKVTFQDHDDDPKLDNDDEQKRENEKEREKANEEEEKEEKVPRRRKVSFKDEEGEPLEEVHIIPPRQVKNNVVPNHQFHKHKPQQPLPYLPQVIYVAKEK